MTQKRLIRLKRGLLGFKIGSNEVFDDSNRFKRVQKRFIRVQNPTKLYFGLKIFISSPWSSHEKIEMKTFFAPSLPLLKECVRWMWEEWKFTSKDVCIMTVTYTWLIIGTFSQHTHIFIDIIWLMCILSFIWFSLLDFMTLLEYKLPHSLQN